MAREKKPSSGGLDGAQTNGGLAIVTSDSSEYTADQPARIVERAFSASDLAPLVTDSRCNSRGQWRGRCPICGSKALSWTDGRERLVAHCHSCGASLPAVLASLGLSLPTPDDTERRLAAVMALPADALAPSALPRYRTRLAETRRRILVAIAARGESVTLSHRQIAEAAGVRAATVSQNIGGMIADRVVIEAAGLAGREPPSGCLLVRDTSRVAPLRATRWRVILPLLKSVPVYRSTGATNLRYGNGTLLVDGGFFPIYGRLRGMVAAGWRSEPLVAALPSQSWRVMSALPGTVAGVASDIEVAESTVRRTLAPLAEVGLVIREKRGREAGRWTADWWRAAAGVDVERLGEWLGYAEAAACQRARHDDERVRQRELAHVRRSAQRVSDAYSVPVGRCEQCGQPLSGARQCPVCGRPVASIADQREAALAQATAYVMHAETLIMAGAPRREA